MLSSKVTISRATAEPFGGGRPAEQNGWYKSACRAAGEADVLARRWNPTEQRKGEWQSVLAFRVIPDYHAYLLRGGVQAPLCFCVCFGFLLRDTGCRLGCFDAY